MSGQQNTGIGVTLDLEALFLSREFGRRPVRAISTAPATVASEPAQLEQVFLSEVFGHPEVVTAATQAVALAAPAAAGRPALLLLKGGGEGRLERDSGRARAIAAVSGVAAAALVVAGLASGTGPAPDRSGVTQAQAQGVPGPAGSHAAPGESPVPANAPGAGPSVPSGAGGTRASLASYSTPGIAAHPHPTTTTGGAAPALGSPSGGSSPGAPTGGGGSGTLPPSLDAVGTAVSSAGSGVTSTSGQLGQALPVAPVIQALGTVATTAANNNG